MHFYTNDVVATSKIPILSPRVRFPVGVFFFAPMPYDPTLPPWAKTRSHEYPSLAGEATDFPCGHRSGPGRVCDFWCWNDLEWTGFRRVGGDRTETVETTIMFFLELGAVPMRDRVDGVRRDVLRRSPGLGPHAKIPRLESLQAQSWTPHPRLTQQCNFSNQPVPGRWLD